MRFKFLTGDVNWMQHDGTWISAKQNNGEFDYWLCIRILNWEETCGSDAPKQTYHVELLSVSPSEAGQENLTKAFRCAGLEERTELHADPLVQVDMLLSYGVYAPLWQADGNNAHQLLKQAREQARCAAGLYGFYMDGPKNRIGATGWDVQRGNFGLPK